MTEVAFRWHDLVVRLLNGAGRSHATIERLISRDLTSVGTPLVVPCDIVCNVTARD
jgi:hypothetical protein